MVVFNNYLKNGQIYLILLGVLIGGIFLKIVMAPVVLLLMFLFWRNDRWTEMLLLFVTILIMSDSLVDSLTWVKSFKNLLILEVSAFFFIDRRKFEPINQLFLKFLPYIVIAFIALYASVNVVTGFMKGVSYLLLFIVVPNIVSYCYREYKKTFVEDIVSFCLFVVLISVAFRFVLPGIAISDGHGGRMQGVFGNPNGLGLFVILVFILYHIARKKFDLKLNIIETVFFYGIILLCAMWSGSRNCLMSILMFVVLNQVFRYSNFLGLIFFAFGMIYFDTIINLVIEGVQSFGLGESLRVENITEGSGRLIAWKFAWDKIQEYYLLGRGFSYDVDLMRANFDRLSRLGHEGGVHNSYLILWLNAGLIGLVAFFRGFFLLFIGASKNTYFALPFMFAVLTSITFEPWITASLNPLTIIFLIISTLILYHLNPINEEDSIKDEEENEIKLESYNA